MNTKQIKHIKEKLKIITRSLELEKQHLIEMRENILSVSENEDILDEDAKKEHYNEIELFKAWVDDYNIIVTRHNKDIKKYHVSVDIQETIDGSKV